MNPKWLMGVVILYLILAVWSGILEGSYLTSNQTSVLDDLMSPEQLSYSNPVAAISSVFVIAGKTIHALWTILVWDFAQFNGDFAVFRLPLIALSIGIIIAIVISVRGA
jgi:hypothetical protein